MTQNTANMQHRSTIFQDSSGHWHAICDDCKKKIVVNAKSERVIYIMVRSLVKNRSQSLDVLRGIAVLLVICYHFPLIPVLSKIGWCGVDLFFVLSGYLISGLLFAEYLERGTIDVSRFWLRRGFKIWPALYVFLLLMTPWLLNWPNGEGLPSLRAAALYYANFVPVAKLIGHTWSLAIEEHFYLALPILLLALGRKRLQWIPWIGFTVCCVCLLVRYRFPQGAWQWTPCRIDALFAGVVLRYWREFKPDVFRSISHSRNLIGAALLLGALALPSLRMGQFGFLALSLAFAIILAWAIEHQPHAALRPLAFIGFYSYSVYLWQQPFTGLYGRFPHWWSFILIVSAAIAFGIAMAKLVEIPVLALRDRWLPRTDRAPFPDGELPGSLGLKAEDHTGSLPAAILP